LTILDNTIPIDVGFGSFLTDIDYQAIELYPYTSYNGAGYGCPSTDNNWIISGALPSGLSLNGSTGVISGTVNQIFDDSLLTKMVSEYPNTPTTILGNDQSEYYYGNAKFITRSFGFTIIGFNLSSSGSTSIVYGEIMVVKNYNADVIQWKKSDIFSIGAK